MYEMISPRYDVGFRPWRRVFGDWLTRYPYPFNYPSEYTDWTPESDIVEDDKHYVVTMEVPGIDMKKTDISYKDGNLMVKGEKHIDTAEGESCVCSERFSGSFTRNFLIAGDVDVDKIDATYKDGILKVMLPKSEKSMTKKIVIH